MLIGVSDLVVIKSADAILVVKKTSAAGAGDRPKTVGPRTNPVPLDTEDP